MSGHYPVEPCRAGPYVPGSMTNPPNPLGTGPTGASTALSAFAAMDKRSREIFREIVQSYLDTGEPVEIGRAHV